MDGLISHQKSPGKVSCKKPRGWEAGSHDKFPRPGGVKPKIDSGINLDYCKELNDRKKQKEIDLMNDIIGMNLQGIHKNRDADQVSVSPSKSSFK
jgi:hypothetical protein